MRRYLRVTSVFSIVKYVPLDGLSGIQSLPNLISAWVPPRFPLGELTTLPQTLQFPFFY